MKSVYRLLMGRGRYSGFWKGDPSKTRAYQQVPARRLRDKRCGALSAAGGRPTQAPPNKPAWDKEGLPFLIPLSLEYLCGGAGMCGQPVEVFLRKRFG
jgi:hypothetical protein